VCGEEDALNILEHLRECSLLLSAPQSEGEPRFHMLEIIREYAFEQLEARGDTAANEAAARSVFPDTGRS
jgi:hypothetical protein